MMDKAAMVIALAAFPAILSAQAATPGCTAAAYRNFDFWVGQWEVADTSGQVRAKSTIERSAAGCAILEHWQPLGGPDGNSISWYTANDSAWHQQWVGGGDWIARFLGWFRDGVLTIVETESSLPASAGKNRMSYTLLPDGRVKQWQENTKDGGKTWTTQFVGYYRRVN